MLKRFVLSFLLALVASVAAYAQNGFVIQNGASSANHTNGSPTLGSNALIALYWTGSAFVTDNNDSHTCGTPATICGGVKVKLTSETAVNGIIYSDYITVLFASPNQINVVTPVFPTQATNWTVAIEYHPDVGAPLVPERTKTGVFFEITNLQPFLSTLNLDGNGNKPMLLGTLYGYTVDGQGNITGSTALKSLTDGTANPRTYNGHPTFFQAYWTGGTNDQDSLRTHYEGTYFRQSTIYNSYPGQSVANIEINGYGTWDAGMRKIKLQYGVGGGAQSNPTEGYVWFAN